MSDSKKQKKGLKSNKIHKALKTKALKKGHLN